MQNELDISEADTIEFQKIIASGGSTLHKISQHRSSLGLCEILTELVTSWTQTQKEKGPGILADLPKDIVNCI